MPFYTEDRDSLKRPLTLEEYEPGTGRVIANSFMQALNYNPAKVMHTLGDLYDDQDEDFAWDAVDFRPEPGSLAKMETGAQAQLIKDSGLEGFLKPDPAYSEDALKAVIAAKKEENARAMVYDKASTAQAWISFPVGLAASMLDPINIATAFIPVPGLSGAKMTAQMARATGILGRTGLRAAEGAAAGAMGATMVEPIIATGMSDIQADYSMANSLMNVAFGTLAGGIFKSGGGAIADMWRAAKGKPLPWQYIPISEESAALREAKANEIAEAMKLTDMGRLEPEKIRGAAEDTATVYDTWFRHVAYKKQKPIQQVYDEWELIFKDGEFIPREKQARQTGYPEPEAQALRDMGLDDLTIELSLGPRPRNDPAYLDLENGYPYADAHELRETGTPEIVIESVYGKPPEPDVVAAHSKSIMPPHKFAWGHTFDAEGNFKIRDEGEIEWRSLGKNQDGREVVLSSEQADAIQEMHPDFRGWDRIGDTVANGESYALGRNYLTRGDTIAYVKDIGNNRAQLVVAAPVKGANGEYLRVLTAFEDDTRGIAYWVQERQPAGAVPAVPIGALYQSAANGRRGAATTIVGQNLNDNAHYELREMSDLIASHDPNHGFARRQDYPAGVQERPYHDPNTGEHTKVEANAAKYNPAYVLTDDATPVNGPPIITQDGIVLGGNSRTMTLGLVYQRHPEAAANYRQMLKSKASQFGLDPAAVDGMQQPVLVRVLDNALDEVEMTRHASQYNQSTTHKLQAEAEGISRGRAISKGSLAEVAAGIEREGTLNELLNSPASRDLANMLVDDGAILPSEYSSLTLPDGRLNEDGKRFVRNALRGLVVPDYDTLSRLPKGVAGKLDQAVPAAALLRNIGGEWDLSGAITRALKLVNEAHQNGRDLASWLGQVDLVARGDKSNPVVQTLALTFKNADAAEVKTRLELFARDAEKGSTGQGSLLGGVTKTPEEAFKDAFGRPVASVDGVNIANFRPDKIETHAALKWANDNGGRSNTRHRDGRVTTGIEKALERLERKLKDAKLSADEKKLLMKYHDELVRFSGKVNVYEPKLGDVAPPNLAGKLEIPGPYKADIAQGPKVDAEIKGTGAEPGAPIEEKSAPAPVIPEEFSSARAAVTFIGERKAVISFFKSADLTSAPHEIYHVIRRQLEFYANDPKSGAEFRRSWEAACDFVGAKPGEKWTPAQEEKFARAGERYLMTGIAPTPHLNKVFESMKERFMEVYADAEAAGLTISKGMKETFDEMFSVPIWQGEERLQAALRDIAAKRWELDLYDPNAKEAGPPSTLLQGAELSADVPKASKELAVADAEVAKRLDMIEQSDLPHAKEIAEGFREELAAADKEIQITEERGKLLEDLMACNMAGGH